MKKSVNIEENAEVTKNVFDIPSPEEMTLINAMKFLYDKSGDSGLTDEFYRNAQPVLNYVGLMLPVNSLQAVLLSVILAESQDGQASVCDFMNHLNIDKLDMIEIKEEVNDLVRKGLVKIDQAYRRGGISYVVSDGFMSCLKNDLPFVEKDLTHMAEADFFEEIAVILSGAFESGNDDSVAHAIILDKVDRIVSANLEIPFAKRYLEHADMDSVSKIVFLYWAKELAVRGCRDIALLETPLNRILTKTDQGHLVRSLRRGVSPLISRGLMSGIKGERDTYRLTDSVAMEFGDIPEQDPVESAGRNMQGDEYTPKIPLMSPDKIVRRELFFNEADRPQVENLRKVMNPENHKAICERMEKAGLRKGICIVLAGESGVGKSELVYQMAAESGRSIMKVDVSSVKDKYIGESEKKLAAIFDEYKALCRKSDVCPILFLNECDQIMSKRVDLSAESSGGDRVDNAIQDMFLEQMETLEGLMVCTTNLAGNLDEAYERRILFKVELGRPDQQTRLRIWKSLLPFIDDAYAEEFSKSFDFSGGQIENISRKSQILQIIDGVDPSFEQLKDFCMRECFTSKRAVKPVSGFGAY